MRLRESASLEDPRKDPILCGDSERLSEWGKIQNSNHRRGQGVFYIAERMFVKKEVK